MFYCLKVGDKYKPDHVHKLANHVPDLVCLTDDPTGLDVDYKLLPDLPLEKWWWKMILFNEEFIPDSGKFLDLDIKIKKPIDGMFEARQGSMTLLYTDWENLEVLNMHTIGDRYKYCSINSTVMAWNKENRHFIWEHFIENKDKIQFLFSGIDQYLEHVHLDELTFFDRRLVGSYRCNPHDNVYIMSYDGEGKDGFDLYDEK